MNQRGTVAILGVGLIGGSIGLALRSRGLARRVMGVGRRESTLEKALGRGAITEATTDLARGVAEAELVVVCTPICNIVEHVRAAAEHAPPGAIITDAGSIKGEIVAALEGELPRGAVFVGSHPMAGSEKTGPEFADENLFQDRVTIVTPTESTPPPALAAVEEFWQSLGARTVRMTPEEHDAAVAAISHVPHLVAAALAAVTPEEWLPLAAGGWCDTTRVAAGDVELWRQILAGNRSHVLRSLAEFEKTLASFREALTRGDDAELVRLLEQGKRRRDAVAS
jgi:prephenate dehydrogenase